MSDVLSTVVRKTKAEALAKQGSRRNSCMEAIYRQGNELAKAVSLTNFIGLPGGCNCKTRLSEDRTDNWAPSPINPIVKVRIGCMVTHVLCACQTMQATPWEGSCP